MKLTLKEAADRSGIGWSTLRTQVHRGRIASSRGPDGRIVIDEADLDAFVVSEGLREVADKMEEVAKGLTTAKAAAKAIGVEVGNVIGRMPQEIRDAVLDGIPTAKRPGGPEAFRKASKGKTHPVPEYVEEPHHGFPVGHQHKDGPRWKRTAGSTWALGDATFTWNGAFWEGGGSRAGKVLEDPVSPAHPESSMRPLAGGGVVAK